MSKSQIQWEFLQDVSKLISFAFLNGFKLTGGELKRTSEQQQLYVDQGKSKTMNSDHLHSLAIDLNIFYDYDDDGDKDYLSGTVSNTEAIEISKKLTEYWKSLNPLNYCGADWGWDLPHFGRKMR